MANTPPIILIPLKQMDKVDVGIAIRSSIEDVARMANKQPPAASLQAASDMQGMRDRLASIDRLTYANAEEAGREFLRYAEHLKKLEKRYDAFGQELGLTFKWRSAFKPKNKAYFNDLQWERVNVLWNAAASYNYQASQAQPRGASQGGLKQAAACFSTAAYCLDVAHDLVKGAIWGLQPRWSEPLTADCRLESLAMFRDLMLAQAQRCAYEKAVAEQIGGDKLQKKLAADAAALFAEVAGRLPQLPELLKEIEGEGGMFSSKDKAWAGRIDVSRDWADALAHEHAAAHAMNPSDEMDSIEFGLRVAHLRRARDLAAQAVKGAEGAAVPRNEYGVVADGKGRLQGLALEAEKQNAEIYFETPPHQPPRIEAQRLAKLATPESLPDLASLSRVTVW